MQNLSTLVVHGVRVLTTRQLAGMYGTESEIINNNFIRNKTKYVLEKHYISVSGEEMRQLKTSHQFDGELKRVSRAYFWTEKGALLHAKSLNTDKAWEVYDYLVDFYFREKDKPIEVKKPETKAPGAEKESGFKIPEMKNPIWVFGVLLKLAQDMGIEVNSYDFQKVNSALHKGEIGIRTQLLLEQVIYELAYELSHVLIHYDCGNMVESPLRKDYDTQAERAASMVIQLLNLAGGIAVRRKDEPVNEIMR